MKKKREKKSPHRGIMEQRNHQIRGNSIEYVRNKKKKNIARNGNHARAFFTDGRYLHLHPAKLFEKDNTIATSIVL